LLELSKQTGMSGTHTFWKNEGGGQFLSSIPWGEAASCVSMSDRVVVQHSFWNCQNQQGSANEGKPVSVYLRVLGANCINCHRLYRTRLM
jgi:hypothetical protein